MRISIFDYDNSLKLTNARPPASWAGTQSSADRSRNSVWEEQPASIRRIGKDDNVWNESIIAAVKNRAEDPFTVTVLMTARDMHASTIVINDLDAAGICLMHTFLMKVFQSLTVILMSSMAMTVCPT